MPPSRWLGALPLRSATLVSPQLGGLSG